MSVRAGMEADRAFTPVQRLLAELGSQLWDWSIR